MKEITDIISYDPGPSWLSYFRARTGRVNVFRYDGGIYKYKAFPPRRGFSDYDKSYLEALVFHSSIIGDSTLNSQFKGLKRLFITPDVSSISEHSFGNIDIELLQIDSPDTYFSTNAFDALSTTTLIYGNNRFTNVSKYKKARHGNKLAHIHKDDDNRLCFEIGEKISYGEADRYEKVRSNLSDDEYEKRNEYKSISDLLEESSITDGSSVFFYTRKNENSLGAKAVIDTFPLSDMRLSNPPDDELVAIYVNDVNELDLASLSKYPNIRQVFVSPTVKAVYGKVNKSKTVSYSDHTATWSEWENAKGSPVKVVCVSKETLLLEDRVPKDDVSSEKEKNLGDTSKEIEI